MDRAQNTDAPLSREPGGRKPPGQVREFAPILGPPPGASPGFLDAAERKRLPPCAEAGWVCLI